MSNRGAPLFISLAIILADRWSKLAIQRSMTPFDVYSVVPGWLRIIHTENPGAAFGILAEGNRWLRSGILIGVSTLVLLFVGSAMLRKGTTFTSLLARLALALVFGGAIGNLYDRLFRGTVTDFIEVYHAGWSFPAFNVADSAISVGAVLLLFELVRPRKQAGQAQLNR